MLEEYGNRQGRGTKTVESRPTDPRPMLNSSSLEMESEITLKNKNKNNNRKAIQVSEFKGWRYIT